MNKRDAVQHHHLPLDAGQNLAALGESILRYGLVLILLASGAYKFTEYEAKNIEPLVANSPLFAWAYNLLGLRGISAVIGGMEIVEHQN